MDSDDAMDGARSGASGDVLVQARGREAATLAAIARLDAAQHAIEEGNAALVNAHGPALLPTILRDALDASGPQLQQAVALHLLAALVAAAGDATSGGASLVGAMYQHALPQTLLQCVAGVPPALLANPSRASRRGVLVVSAQLALLLALVQAGSSAAARQAAAHALFTLQPLQHLTGCRAIDLEPEEPGAGGGFGAGRLRGAAGGGGQQGAEDDPDMLRCGGWMDGWMDINGCMNV
jgi:hypothetical protein